MARNRSIMGTKSQSFNRSNQSTPIEIDKNSPSKNLAHVPCKFFKQGTCQAGSSCPFSHTVDANIDTAPCKYFQKGNCKFGVKCALAHILPDGRRVNPKSLAQAYQNQNNNGNSHNGNGHNGNGNGGSNNHNGNGNHIINGSRNNYDINNGNNNGFLSQQSHYQSTSPQANISPQQQNGGFNYDYFKNQQTSPNVSSTFTNQSTRNSFSNQSSFLYGPATPNSNTTTNQVRTTSMSEQRPSTFTSNSIWSNPVSSDSIPQSSFYANQRSVSHSASFRPTFTSLSFIEHENAIVDDDENDMFEEDFVPSSLSDLLTPQELQRRGSRPTGSRAQVYAQLDTPPLEYEPATGTANSLISGSDVGITDHDETEETQFRMDDDEFHYSSNGNDYSNIGKTRPGVIL